jgi:hypothetical protein
MADTLSGVSDSDLLVIANQVVAAATATPADYGATAADVLAITVAANEFETSIATQAATIAASRSATSDKNTKHETLEVLLRNFRNTAKAKNTSDPLMASLGIPIGSPSLPANATVPLATVDTSQRMKHTIHFTDQAANGNKTRPRGAMGAEIWVKIGDPAPGSEKDCTFLAVDSATPYVAEYEAADANKTAHYMLRWRMRDGSLSAWGETVSATITG